jgi:hypothetical protein
MHTHTIFILERKEGEIGKQRERETEKERVRLWELCGKKDLGVCHKTDHWEQPTDQFLG